MIKEEEVDRDATGQKIVQSLRLLERKVDEKRM